MNNNIKQLIEGQINHWPLAHSNYKALQQVQTKEFTVNGHHYRVQFNPARIVSSGAQVDAQSIRQRPCFLCAHHRPKEQNSLPFGRHYELLVNPFPIFPKHLTVPDVCHVEQHISGRYADMLRLARLLTDFTVFYNGPRCGASAPDHLHFQAGSRHFLPIEEEWEQQKDYLVTRKGQAALWRLKDAPRSTWVLESTDAADAEALFQLICQSLPLEEGDTEPKMNLLAFYEEGRWVNFIFPRSKHRPTCYTAKGTDNLLCSPASVDLGGIFILPQEKDFLKITPDDIARILQEVCLEPAAMQQAETRLRKLTEPTVAVGILTAREIHFQLLTPYQADEQTVQGHQTTTCQDGKVYWNGKFYDELLFTPTASSDRQNAAFELQEVTIGIEFHWERRENQRFPGVLKIISNGESLIAINLVKVEDYLTSVISSEMSANASPALLMAHAVISRSWLLAQIQHLGQEEKQQPEPEAHPGERIRWYNREDHTLYDVCADDHCQRYQGITRASTPQVRQAIEATRGEVLVWNHHICDARFSKCCGGALEEFRYCWEDRAYPYLHRKRDWHPNTTLPNLTEERQAEQWIRRTPEAFCHTKDRQILSQVLNNYDQETTDFYRWQVSYQQEELAALIRRRSGVDFGHIIDLQPLARGTSGRIWKLKIIGSKQTLTIGKELEIRRILSPSHLYSSAFVVDREEVSTTGIPARFVLTGAGWGHGVGLCQIGAAVMGEQGYSYQEILQHYYPETSIEIHY